MWTCRKFQRRRLRSGGIPKFFHCRRTLTDYFGKQEGGYLWDRLHGSLHSDARRWLNQAEIEISLFARQCLGRRRIPSLAVLEWESRAWNRQINRDRVKINLQFTQKARAKFRYGSNYFRLDGKLKLHQDWFETWTGSRLYNV